MSLFREEALKARSGSLLGEIQLRTSGWTTLATLFAVALGFALVAFLFLGRYTSRTAAVGQLEPSTGLITLQPLVSGTMASVAVQEGQQVAAGDLLATVAVDPIGSDGTQVGQQSAQSLTERRLATEESAGAELERLDQVERALVDQIAASRVERNSLGDELETTRRRADLAARARQNMQRVQAKGYLSALQLQQAEAAELEIVANLQSLQRADAALSRELVKLEQQLSEIPVQKQALAARARAERAVLSQFDAEASLQRARTIVAPSNGVITARFVEPGQSVQPTSTILTLMPAGASLQAHLLVPSRAIGFIEAGDRVRMRFPAFPYQRFGHQMGRVLRVSRSSVAIAPGETGDTLYRVVVALDNQFVVAYGKRETLLPGMRVEADVLIEDRRLVDWILEPLYALTGRVG